MPLYKVPYTKYFEFKDTQEIKTQFDIDKELCREPMNQLIEKYNLKSKKILSIGSAAGFEEYWFYKNDCTLTLLDYDEGNILESYLKKIPTKENEDVLTYIIDDANNFRKYLTEKFDAIYFSGFTPNILANRSIYQKYQSSKIRRGLNLFSRKTKIDFLQKQAVWPTNEKPFVDLIMKILESILGIGGLFIYQSFGSYIDSRSINYIESVKEQLDSINIRLLDAYYLINEPHVRLIIGYKDSLSEAKKFANEIRKNPDINKFHGRGIANLSKFQGIKKLYNILN